MTRPEFPNPAEIALAIEKCEAILAKKELNQRKNFHLKEGYSECLRMLKDRLINADNPFFVAETEDELELAGTTYAQQMFPIRKLKTEIGRTLAVLCNDFLNGQNSSHSFLDESILKKRGDKVLQMVVEKYKARENIEPNLLSNDGQRYTAIMDNKFKMSGIIRVVDGQVYLEQDEQHGAGFADEVEKKYYWAINDGSPSILEFMGISEFKVLPSEGHYDTSEGESEGINGEKINEFSE